MQEPTLNQRQVELEAAGMTRRQATAYKLAGTPPKDARFHEDVVLGPKYSAYTILAIVWIRDVPHWRAAVTLSGPAGVILPEKSTMALGLAAYACADGLLKGVGEGSSVTHPQHASFVATKPLSASERAGLVVSQSGLVVDVSDEADRELRSLD